MTQDYLYQIQSSVQSLSHVRLIVTPWTAAHQASLSITNSRNPPKPMSIESVMPSNHLILCRPLLLLPSIFPSITVFSNESALSIRWSKDWSFSFNTSPINEHPGLISFRMDWLDLLAVQGTLKSLLQHHRSKASVLQHSAFFTVQLSQYGSQNSKLGRNHSRAAWKKRKSKTFVIRRSSFRFWLCPLLCKLEEITPSIFFSRRWRYSYHLPFLYPRVNWGIKYDNKCSEAL